MTKLKTVFAIFLMIIGLQNSYSQTYRFKTTSVSVSEKTDKGTWEKWSKAQNVNLIVTLDTKKDRVVVYSQIIQLFEIIDYTDEKITPTEDTVSFVCKNNDGEDCTVSIITRKNQGNRKQLYITYDDRILNYNIVNFK